MAKLSVAPVDRTVAPSLVPDQPAIDLAHLARMTFGEENLEGEVLRLFDRQAAMLLARMAGAPPSEVAAFAHTLTGSARGIGAWQVAKAAEAVEQAARDRDPSQLAGATHTLAAAVKVVRMAIAELLRASAVSRPR